MTLNKTFIFSICVLSEDHRDPFSIRSNPGHYCLMFGRQNMCYRVGSPSLSQFRCHMFLNDNIALVYFVVSRFTNIFSWCQG